MANYFFSAGLVALSLAVLCAATSTPAYAQCNLDAPWPGSYTLSNGATADMTIYLDDATASTVNAEIVSGTNFNQKSSGTVNGETLTFGPVTINGTTANAVGTVSADCSTFSGEFQDTSSLKNRIGTFTSVWAAGLTVTNNPVAFVPQLNPLFGEEIFNGPYAENSGGTLAAAQCDYVSGNCTMSMELSLQNAYNEPLVLIPAVNSGVPYFSIGGCPVLAPLAPGATCQMQILFDPHNLIGNFDAQIEILSPADRVYANQLVHVYDSDISHTHVGVPGNGRFRFRFYIKTKSATLGVRG